MSKKILILLPYLNAGGAEKMSTLLAEELTKRGWYITILVLFKLSHNKTELVLNEKINLIKLDVSNKIIRNFVFLKIASIAKDYDIIIAGLELAATNYGFLGASLSNKPFIAWNHTSFHILEKRINFFDKTLSHLFFKKIKYIVFPSNGGKKSLKISIKKQPINSIWTVIENYSVLDQCSIIDPIKDIDKIFSKPVIISIGRLSEEKAFQRLLKAHAHLVKKGINHNLVILGEGIEREYLKAEICHLKIQDSVFMPGHVKDIKTWLKKSTLFAMTSLYEGLPLAMIEALYAGLPIVAMNCPFGPSEILDGGIYGILTPDGDEKAFQDALEQVLSNLNLRQYYKEQSIIRSEYYQPDRIISQWELLLKQALNTTPS